MKQDKTRREERQERRHPHRPPKPPTSTTAAPSPPPPPPVEALTYIVRIYDYTDRYAPHAQKIANYYASWLREANSGVEVYYIRMPPLDYATCSQTTPPLYGIRLCEDVSNLSPGISASSTGMRWIPTGPSTWELSSYDQFFIPDPESISTCFNCHPQSTNTVGEMLLCHEIGHSFGLGHRGDPGGVPLDGILEPSCLGGGDQGYSPGTLIDEEKSLILGHLPTPGAASARSLITPGHTTCELPAMERT